MKKHSQLQLFQNFIQKQQQRAKVSIGGQIEAMLDYCQYVIHTQFDKKVKAKYKFKQRKKDISEDFMRAFGTLDRQDKITYYIKNVIYLLRLSSGNIKVPKVRNDIMETSVYTLSYNIKRWKEKKMRLDNARQIMLGEYKTTIKQYDLGDYIFRGSKNNKYYTFVLQAINQSVQKKLKTVHIGFLSPNQMKQWAQAVQLCIDFRHWQRIYIELFKKQPPRQTMPILPTKYFIEKQTFQTTPIAQIKQKEIIQNRYNQPQKFHVQPKLQQKMQQFQSVSSLEQGDIPEAEKTIVQYLVGAQDQAIGDLQSIQNKNLQENTTKNMKNLNIFSKMFPQFDFNQLQLQNDYESLQNDHNFRILQHSQQKQRFKIILQFQSKADISQLICNSICGPEFITVYNQNVEVYQIKTFISSENAAIFYMVLKQFNRLYRSRDFVFIRHAFKIGNNALYIADKNIQNANYPPFITIVRGKYECIWGILRKQNKYKMVVNIYMDNSGYLNDNQNTNLTLNYIKNFAKLRQFIANNQSNLKNYILFDLKWDITKQDNNLKQNQFKIKRNTQKNRQNQKKLQQKIEEKKIEKKNYIENLVKNNSKSNLPKFQQNSEPESSLLNKQKQLALQREKMNIEAVQGQIDLKQVNKSKLETKNQINLKFDQKGRVIIQPYFRKHKYQLKPLNNYPIIYWKSPVVEKHPLWMNDWKHDEKIGGLIFINQKKINDQKGVLKFILSKVGKNILSGKSILNISLPVDIFVDKSNLQLISQSFCYGPILLQKLQSKNQLDKLKAVVAFGISMSPLYLIMEKPFNPILGQTFQAWINGCPIYAQQISHHPPICSILFYGRGYTISGQIQSKAQVHVNSGTGTNQGILTIKFDGGQKYYFSSAGGQVSGLAYGDRKFNIKGKSYCWSGNQDYFVEVSYNPTKKGFFSMKKQEQPQDYFQGDVVKVTNEFIASLPHKKRAPSEKQIIKTFGKIHGIWHQQYLYENQTILDINKQLPLKIQYEKYPLPSDSNWREDIAYRRLMQIPKAQSEKERLQILQRNDRKLREKK